MGSWGYISEYGGDCVLCGKGTTKDEDYHSYYPDIPMVALAATEKVICNVCADEDWQDQLVELGDETGYADGWNRVWPNMSSSEAESFATKGNQQCSHCYELIREACINKACNDEWVCDDCWDCWFCEECKGCTSYHPQKYAGNPCECLNAESFAAQETKALSGGTLPVPMIWVDQGGQLPYSHVVVDITGSMGHPQMIPNYSGSEVFSRVDYALTLIGILLRNKSITPENQDLSSRRLQQSRPLPIRIKHPSFMEHGKPRVRQRQNTSGKHSFTHPMLDLWIRLYNYLKLRPY